MGEQSSQHKMKVGIVGGGIGGLAAAIALSQKGIAVTVFEKNQIDKNHHIEDSNDDYPLIIHFPGVLAFEELGLIEKIKAQSSELKGMSTFVQSNGRTLLFLPILERVRLPIKINKTELRNILLHECLQRGVEILWNHKVICYKEEYHVPEELQDDERYIRHLLDHETPNQDKDVKEMSEKWKKTISKVAVKLCGGHTHPQRFDVLVGADGMRSTIRQQLVGDEVNYLGLSSILGVLESADAPNLIGNVRFKEGVMTVLANDGTSLYVIPQQSRKEITWFFTIPSKEHSLESYKGQNEALKELIMKHVANWFPLAKDIVIKTRPENIRNIYGLYDREVQRPFFHREFRTFHSPTGCITLLGDAAYLMSSFQGRGVSFALVNAVHLANVLSAVPLAEKLPLHIGTSIGSGSKTNRIQSRAKLIEGLAKEMSDLPSSYRIPFALTFYEMESYRAARNLVRQSSKVPYFSLIFSGAPLSI
jgi:2-polyprenyl-6-methoxyphenol hydroxylase-like FAD-dependent oxidoreductase